MMFFMMFCQENVHYLKGIYEINLKAQFSKTEQSQRSTKEYQQWTKRLKLNIVNH